MNAPFFVAIMVFCVLTLLMVAIFAYVRHAGERRKLLARMETGGGSNVSESAVPAAAQHLPFKRYLRALGDLAKPKKEEELMRINKRFIQAGYRGKNMVVVFFGAKVLCAGFLSLASLCLQPLVANQMTMPVAMFVCLGLALVGFYLPSIWLNLKVSGRKDQLTHGLPDALDLLVVCVEAGMGLDSAIKRVGEEMKLSNRSISEEFKLLNLELRAGKSRRDALKNLAFRTGLDDVSSLVTLLIQTEKFGTSVGQALRVHADSMRTKRSQRIEVLAGKLPVKLLFPTIFFIFPSLFVVLMGPALIQVHRIWIGR